MDTFFDSIDRVMISSLFYSSPKIIKLLNSNSNHKRHIISERYLLPENYAIIPIKNNVNKNLYEYFEEKYQYLLLNKEGMEIFCITESIKSLLEYFQIPRSANDVKTHISDSQEKECVKYLLQYNIIQQNYAYNPLNSGNELSLCKPFMITDKYSTKRILASNHNSITYIVIDNSGKEYVFKIFKNNRKALENEIAIRERLANQSFLPKLIEINMQKHFVVLEYVRGYDARTYLSHNPSIEAIENIAHNIIEVLSILHSNSYIHGDIHLGQFIIGRDKHITLTDWELLVDLTSHNTSSIVQGGVFEYLSPEIIQPNCFNPVITHKPSTITEVYRLGVIIYYLFYREFPFVGMTWTQLYESIKNDSLDLLSYNMFNQNIPKKIIDIISLCLKKDPENRVISADKLL